MLQLPRIFLIFSIVCALSTAAPACIDHCDKAKCPLQTLNCSPGRSIFDLCNCCPVCLQGINQTCGGINGELGRCETGLDCIFLSEEGHYFNATELGTCQDVKQPTCQFHHTWGCMVTSTSECACVNITTCDSPTSFPFHNLEECTKFLPSDFNDVESKNCSKESCSNNQLEPDRGSCPEDSYQSLDKAKNQHQGCECLPSACPMVKCSEGLHLKIFRNGSKIPGACCTLFGCVNESDLVCHSEGKAYDSGETWKVDVCTRCLCDKGLTFCQTTSCDLSKKCGYMVVPEGECCPICNGCISPSGKFFKNGMAWKEDDCTACQCQDGKMSCQAEMCQTSCSNPRTMAGYCCPVCDGSDINSVESQSGRNSPLNDLAPSLGMCRGDNNKRYGLGEMWFDGCRHCYCHSGREMCAVLTCPVLLCAHPKLLPGNCCPTCSRKNLGREHPYSLTVCQAVDGHYHVEGETWSLDPCTWCICMQGQVLCEATQCPPTPCAHPTHHMGSCCSTCSDLGHLSSSASSSSLTMKGVCYSEDGSTVYGEGQKWRPNPCQSCLCLKGKVQCFQESCPPMEDCLHPMLVKHRCCPVCLGSKSSRSMLCLQDGRAYRDGERWTVNDCTSCICLKGMQMCTEKICSPWCPRPLHLPGQCCPICEGESVEYNHQSANPQQHLSLAMVIICAAIMVLLLFVVVFLVLVVLRQRKVSNNNSNSGGQGLCPRQRPKSTNLELQGMSPCNKPLLDSVELKRLQEQGNPVMKNLV